ncbi:MULTISPECIES: hypothetical protein [unclassified Mesorhizobium]|uniref:hypothetical protein n=1 Tax=unclassified Mesorhizobium TaxID=325217 RepID=UPI0024156612|nr:MULTISPECIES: hypothetical protein [unclassified Mesorhizobium]MDG4889987.1 hypothetical protein [Mesorhizobium sp. WSM4887]MDG4904129.1 hypothetical protein [Mesorhizobium sp. WSM4962]MDG4909156.1 hypothetical protein [Mesorhizobium sp. WSM4898]MDG4921780.1 hypothetical protein [Mesorhizobium sp. WSM4989]
MTEAAIQDLIHRFPSCLPIAEIDPLFANPVPICRELSTPAGPIDNFMVTPTGLPVLAECKLWRNPEGRREVVGQILDYAKELALWTSSDLQRETSRRVGREGNVLLDLVRAAGNDVDEISFNDALTLNLRRGRFLLLIVGDGIRVGVETIAEYLQGHSGLHFTLGLVEMPIYELADGTRIVVARVLAKTQTIVRSVIALPDGLALSEDEEEESSGPVETSERRAGRERRNAIRQSFWQDFLSGLHLDDPDQMRPPPALGGHIVFKFGAPGGSSWLTVYRDMRANRVGLDLSSNRNSVGERASKALAPQAEELAAELGPGVTIDFAGDRPIIAQDYTRAGPGESRRPGTGPELASGADKRVCKRTSAAHPIGASRFSGGMNLAAHSL